MISGRTSTPPSAEERSFLRGAVLATLLPALLLASCVEPGEVITVYRDHPVNLEDTEWTPPIEGDPNLIVGVTEDQLFRELEDGDEAPIIEGFQGGFWVHVSVRATGLGRSGRIEARLDAEGEDAAVGELKADLRLTPTREGYSEKSQVPIALTDEWHSHWQDLIGRQGSIELTYTDSEGRVGAQTVQVIFVEN